MIDGDNGSDPTDPNADGLSDDPIDPVDPNASSPSDPGANGDDPNADPNAGQPKKNTAKDRIDELTRLRREAERDRDYYRELALRATPQQQTPQPQQPQAEQAPSPEAYEAGEFDTRYIKDLARWEAKQEVAQALQAANAQSHAMQAEAQWQSRVEKVAENLPDFEEIVVHGAQRGEWACSPIVADALKASAKGPELAYSLALDPAEAARIYRLPPALQLMEIGKLEAKLATPKPRTTTAAPAPTPQVRGSGGKFAVQPDTNDFAAFDKQYGNGS